MLTLARRLFWLAVLGGVGYAVYTAWQRRNEPVPNGPAEWPPLDDASAAPVATASAAPADDVAAPPANSTGAPLPDLGAGTRATAPLPDLGDRARLPAEGPGDSVDAAWVDPTDGVCPVDFPIKGNANSGIYHVPGGRFYDRTVPQRCYATEDAAVADGYRRAKA